MLKLINKTLSTHKGYASLALRAPIGLILSAHGAQKTLCLVWWLWA